MSSVERDKPFDSVIKRALSGLASSSSGKRKYHEIELFPGVPPVEQTGSTLARSLFGRLLGQVAGFIWRNKRWGSYGLVALVVLSVGLAIVSFSVALTSKDLGIQVATDGTVVEVADGSLAQRTGAVVGETTGPLGLGEIERLQTTLRDGQTASLTLFPGTGTSDPAVKEVQVMGQELGAGQKSVAIEGALTALLFMALGLIVLQMRNRNFVTYLLFIGFEAGGLMEVASQSRPYSSWAAVGWAFVMPMCFGTFAHLHMYFPAPRLGKLRNKATIALYATMISLIILNLLQLRAQAGEISLYAAAWYEAVIFTFIAGCLLLATLLLVRTAIENRKLHDRVVKKRLRTLRFAAACFLLMIMAPLIQLLTHLDVDVEAELCSAFGSWVLGIGYTWAMFQGERKLEANMVVRKRVIIALGASVLLLVWLVIAVNLKTALSDEWMPISGDVLNNDALILWGVLFVLALLFGAIIVAGSNWVDIKLFRGGRDVAFVSECSEQLAKYTATDEFIYFFTDILPIKMKTRGNVMLLPDHHAGNMLLQGCTRTLRSRLSKYLDTTSAPVSIDEDLRGYLKDAEHRQPVVLSKVSRSYREPYLTVAGDKLANREDRRRNGKESHAANVTLLTILDSIGAELLLPLRAGPRLVGAVAFCGKDDDEPYTAQELETLAAVGRYAAITIVNINLIEALQHQLEELVSEKERTGRLAQEVYVASSRERAQISREVHDTVLQDLSIASRLLYLVRDDLGALHNEICQLQERSGRVPAPVPADSSSSSAAIELCEESLEILLGELSASAQSGNGSHLPEPYLKTAIDTVYRASQQLRAICTKLRPNYLNLSVVQIVESDVKEAQAACQAPIGLTVSGSEPDVLPDNVKDVLHKVAKIGLSNAVNHSHASSILTNLELGHKAISLTIADKGCGFTLADLAEYQATKRFGLVDIHDHAFMVGGEVTIETAPGKGTTIRFSVSVFPATPSEQPQIAATALAAIEP